VNATTLIKTSGIGNFECIRLEQSEHQLFVGDAQRVAEAAESSILVQVAPAQMISLRSVGFDPSESKMLHQTIPYALEDELVDDVDTLHFAFGKASKNNIPLVIVKRELLQQWLQDSREQGLEIQQVVDELQLLPVSENSWVLLVDEQRWLVRDASGYGFAMEAEIASVALQLMLDEAEQLPEKIVVYCSAQDKVAVNRQLPELLRGIAEWSEQEYWETLAEGFNANKPIDLLQGDFAPSLPWKKWWQQWKWVVVILGAVILLKLVTGFAEIQLLEARNIELRGEIEKSYRSVVPKGAVLDPERQLRRKVNNMKGSSGEGFVSEFNRVAMVLAKIEGLQLQSLNYTAKNSEIRVSVLANDFDAVETARSNLEQVGLKAELTGSSNEGGKTRARLRIKN
jgi:general secretion pathway protein L